MVFRFNIEYKTVYGENLVLNLNMDNEEVHNSLGTTDGLHWSCDLDVTPKTKNIILIFSGSFLHFSSTGTGLFRVPCLRIPFLRSLSAHYGTATPPLQSLAQNQFISLSA